MTTTSARPEASSEPRRRGGVSRDVLDEALGRHEPEPSGDGRLGGPAGNGRLTGWLGAIVLYLVLGQLLTLFDVTKVLTWHVAIGGALVPFALAKTAVTGWRMVNYYRGVPMYRAAGAPPMVLRVLGPLVVLSTLALVGTGLSLVAIGPTGINQPLFSVLGFQIAPITLHQAVFFAFATFTGLHLIARLVPAWKRTVQGHGETPGGGARLAVLGCTAVLAVISSSLVVHALHGWF